MAVPESPRDFSQRLAQRLLREGRISQELCAAAMARKQELAIRFEDALIECGLTEPQLLRHLAEIYKVQFITTAKLAKAKILPRTLRLIPKSLALRRLVVPVLLDASGGLVVVTPDPESVDVLKDVALASQAREVKVLVARPSAVRAAIAKLYEGDTQAFGRLLSHEPIADGAPIQLLNNQGTLGANGTSSSARLDPPVSVATVASDDMPMLLGDDDLVELQSELSREGDEPAAESVISEAEGASFGDEKTERTRARLVNPALEQTLRSHVAVATRAVSEPSNAHDQHGAPAAAANTSLLGNLTQAAARSDITMVVDVGDAVLQMAPATARGAATHSLQMQAVRAVAPELETSTESAPAEQRLPRHVASERSPLSTGKAAPRRAPSLELDLNAESLSELGRGTVKHSSAQVTPSTLGSGSAVAGSLPPTLGSMSSLPPSLGSMSSLPPSLGSMSSLPPSLGGSNSLAPSVATDSGLPPSLRFDVETEPALGQAAPKTSTQDVAPESDVEESPPLLWSSGPPPALAFPREAETPAQDPRTSRSHGRPRSQPPLSTRATEPPKFAALDDLAHLSLSREVSLVQQPLQFARALIALYERHRPELGGHSVMVGELCRLCLVELGRSREEQELAELAGLLHDAGKSRSYHLTSYSVWLYAVHEKRAREQYTLPALMLTTSGLPLLVVEAITHMYERYDGKGFPAELHGEEIPLLSRVLSIVDSFCDLIQNSNNAFGNVLGVADAIDTLRSHAKVFDPGLVEEFARVLIERDIDLARLRARASLAG